MKMIAENYNQKSISILEKHSDFFKKRENIGFWQRWMRLHENLFKDLNLEDFEIKDDSYFEVTTHQFMRKRMLMISAFSQGLKKESSSPEKFSTLKILLKEHDENFQELLKKLKDHFLEELIKSQKVRKVTIAYNQSHLSLGG